VQSLQPVMFVSYCFVELIWLIWHLSAAGNTAHSWHRRANKGVEPGVSFTLYTSHNLLQLCCVCNFAWFCCDRQLSVLSHTAVWVCVLYISCRLDIVQQIIIFLSFPTT